jgi:hypothetical protein
MPIEKFESHRAASQALWCFEPDAEYYRRVANHFNLGWKLYRRRTAKGLFKYRSISEADNGQRDALLASGTLLRC